MFEAQLNSNVNSIECKKTRSNFISKMLGKKELLKKYKVVANVQKMIPFRPARYCLNNNITEIVRNEALRMKIKNDIKKFFENDENSRMAPGKKIVLHKIKKIKKQKRFLNETMLKLYPKFKRMSGYKTSYSFFVSLDHSGLYIKSWMTGTRANVKNTLIVTMLWQLCTSIT